MLNLINDSWIPVLCKDGSRRVIAPWEMADDTLAFPDWPRPDLNIACLELLIGLVFLADPPSDADDWQDRQTPDPDRLRARLAAYAPAFDLMGNGPRFMQDQERFEEGVKDPNPPDMLFIDSAGGQTVKNNADLLVKRARYPVLDPATAAMALFTLQSQAPAGGAGNRTSMRGGGPMVTLVDPGTGLWPLIWANVPDGTPAEMGDLPWMRAVRSSAQGQPVFPHDATPVEAFFGMPRRLRLVAEGAAIGGVVQKPYGANYAGWEHPLTPHYRIKEGAELLPKHPRAGHFGYQNWLGIVAQKAEAGDTARRAKVVDLWAERSRIRADVLVAGWSMDNMKPRDFIFSRAPLIDLPPEAGEQMEGMVEAAEQLGFVLRGSLSVVLAKGEALDAVREAYFIETQAFFEARLAELTAVNFSEVALRWLADLRAVAQRMFNERALPGLADRDTREQAEIVAASRNLNFAFAGYGKMGRAAFGALGLPVPAQKKGKAA